MPDTTNPQTERRARYAAAPTPPSAPADRAAVLREAADAIEEAQHRRDDIVNDAIGFLDNNTEQQHRAVHKAAALLRRMADEQPATNPSRAAGEAQQDETQADDRAAVIAELLPAWEAVYEPGNVADYLIGYANDELPAKAAAEAWLRSQAEVTGRLEWVSQRPLDGYDTEAELVERHDDGIDTGPGITVRRRVAPAVVSQPGKEG